MSRELTLNALAETINASWQHTTEGLLETAKHCAEANNRLKPEEKKAFMSKLTFSPATFSKLIKIGSENQLQADPVKALLPPNYTIVYQVAKLTELERDQAIDDGIISPGMTRADLTDWLAQRKGSKTVTKVVEPPKVIATVQIPQNYDAKKQAKLEQALDKLRQQFEFILNKPKDPEQAAFDRMTKQIDDFIRREARRFVFELKKRALGTGKKLSTAEKKKRWPYAEDETEIRSDATWEEVQAVLEFVVNGDQFERIRDEAFRLHGMPEEVVRTHALDDHDEAMKELKGVLVDFRARGQLPDPKKSMKSGSETWK